MMEYLLIDTLPNISSYEVMEDFMAYNQKDDIRGLYLNSELIDTDCRGFFFSKDFLAIHHQTGSTLYYIYNPKINTIPFIFHKDSFYDDNTIWISRKNEEHLDNDLHKLIFYRLDSFEPLLESTFTPRYGLLRYIGANIYIQIPFEGVNGTLMSAFSLHPHQYLWQLDLGGRTYREGGEEKEVKIGRVIGVWEDQLVVSMSNPEIISIDTQSGRINWETQGLSARINAGLPYYKHSTCLSHYTHLESGKLYELIGSTYYCIDLRTQQVEILWRDDREAGYVSVKHATFMEDHIYFTGSFENRFQPLVLGVFNRKTLQLDWVRDMMDVLGEDPIARGYVSSLNQAPKAGGNKLYVKDSGGTLFIFERTE